MRSDWLTCKVGDVARIQGGYAFKAKDFAETGIPVIKIKNVRRKDIDLTDAARVSDEIAKQASQLYVKEWDVLISMTGSGPNAPASIVGRVARHSGKDNEFLINQRVGRFVVTDNELIDQRFLYYLFSPKEKQLELVSIATGSANQVNISGKQIESLDVTLPTLLEQKTIAHILGSLDDKIELNRQMNETLESMAQALFKSWFVDFDPVIDNALAVGNPIPDVFAERAEQRCEMIANAKNASKAGVPFKGSESNHQSLFPSEFEFTEEIGWIPKGWEQDAVENILQINPRVTLKKGTVARFADMKALPTSGYTISTVIDKEYSGGAKFQQGDVLFARITPCLENGKTGIANFLKDEEVGFGSTEFIVLRGKSEIQTPFVACLARDSNFRTHAKASMVGSSGRQRVQNACFSDYFLALPTGFELLNAFHSLAEPHFIKSHKLSLEIDTLTKLRDTILPKLLSGELRIPDAENLIDEINA